MCVCERSLINVNFHKSTLIRKLVFWERFYAQSDITLQMQT